VDIASSPVDLGVGNGTALVPSSDDLNQNLSTSASVTGELGNQTGLNETGASAQMGNETALAGGKDEKADEGDSSLLGIPHSSREDGIASGLFSGANGSLHLSTLTWMTLLLVSIFLP